MPGRQQLVERQGGRGHVAARQVGRGERLAAEGRVEEVVDQDTDVLVGPATSKLRTFGQSRPVPVPPPVATMLAEVPADGTRSRPVRSRGSAAVKNAAPLQDETPLGPLTQRPWASAPEVAPTGVRSMPLAPKSMVTMAPGGRSGMTGALAGLAPLVTIAGV